jgi:hypothetical protein
MPVLQTFSHILSLFIKYFIEQCILHNCAGNLLRGGCRVLHVCGLLLVHLCGQHDRCGGECPSVVASHTCVRQLISAVSRAAADSHVGSTIAIAVVSAMSSHYTHVWAALALLEQLLCCVSSSMWAA